MAACPRDVHFAPLATNMLRIAFVGGDAAKEN